MASFASWAHFRTYLTGCPTTPSSSSPSSARPSPELPALSSRACQRKLVRYLLFFPIMSCIMYSRPSNGHSKRNIALKWRKTVFYSCGSATTNVPWPPSSSACQTPWALSLGQAWPHSWFIPKTTCRSWTLSGSSQPDSDPSWPCGR